MSDLSGVALILVGVVIGYVIRGLLVKQQVANLTARSEALDARAALLSERESALKRERAT